MDRYSFGNLTHIPIFHYHENMKTTVDLSDNLVREVKNSASSRGSTFREIVESALRSYIQAQHRERGGTHLNLTPSGAKAFRKVFPRNGEDNSG